jgi:hypothetical protein
MKPKPTYELSGLPAAEIAERWWLAFTPDHEPTAAAARFVEKVGAPPEYLVKTPTMLLVGPLQFANELQRHPANRPVPTAVQIPLL